MSLMSSVTVPTTTAILSLNAKERLISTFKKIRVNLLLLAEVSHEA
jgi:hypothetical protein